MAHSRRDDDFDGAHEPDYTLEYLPSTGSRGMDSLRDTIHYEKFKLANWRTFRQHTGHWPVLSMMFHYAAIALMAVGIGVFIWISRDREWSTARSLTIGGSAALAYIAVFLAGESSVRKLDWKLFSGYRHRDS